MATKMTSNESVSTLAYVSSSEDLSLSNDIAWQDLVQDDDVPRDPLEATHKRIPSDFAEAVRVDSFIKQMRDKKNQSSDNLENRNIRIPSKNLGDDEDEEMQDKNGDNNNNNNDTTHVTVISEDGAATLEPSCCSRGACCSPASSCYCNYFAKYFNDEEWERWIFSDENQADQDSAPWYSWIFWTWVDPMLQRGTFRTNKGQSLLLKDYLPLPKCEEPRLIRKLFKEFWDNGELKSFREYKMKKREREIEIRRLHLKRALAAADDDHDLAQQNQEQKEDGSGDNITEKAQRKINKKKEEAFDEDFAALERLHQEQDLEDETKPNLWMALLRSEKRRLLWAAVFRVLSDSCIVALPFFLREFVTYLFDKDAPAKDGWVWAILMGVVTFFQPITHQLSAYFQSNSFHHYRSLIATLIFEKSLEIEGDTNVAGQLNNAHTTDARIFYDLGGYFHYSWAGPLLLLELTVILCYFIGIKTGLLTFCIVLLLLGLQLYLCRKVADSKRMYMIKSDFRISLTNEVLLGFQTCKFLGLENDFEARLNRFREAEVDCLGQIAFSYGSVLGLLSATTYILYVFAFTVAFYFDIRLTGDILFPVSAVLGQMSLPIARTALCYGKYFDSKMALGRIEACLFAREKQHLVDKVWRKRVEMDALLTKTSAEGVIMKGPTNNPDDDDDDDTNEPFGLHHLSSQNISSLLNHNSALLNPLSVDMKNVTVVSHPITSNERIQDVIVAKDLNLQVYRNQFTVVVGMSNSGKSLLLKTLLGETCVDLNRRFREVLHDLYYMKHHPDADDKTAEMTDDEINDIADEERGYIRQFEQPAYVPQQTFILKDTFRSNIVMNEPFDQERYDAVIEACKLRKDINRLGETKDLTIITGKMLSTGVHVKLSFARAAYSKRKLIVADDAISCLDIRLTALLTEKLFCGFLRKEDRTILLVTHTPQVVSKADRVILVNNNAVVFSGTRQSFKDEGYDVSQLSELSEFITEKQNLQAEQQIMHRRQSMQSMRSGDGESSFKQTPSFAQHQLIRRNSERRQSINSGDGSPLLNRTNNELVFFDSKSNNEEDTNSNDSANNSLTTPTSLVSKNNQSNTNASQQSKTRNNPFLSSQGINSSSARPSGGLFPHMPSRAPSRLPHQFQSSQQTQNVNPGTLLTLRHVRRIETAAPQFDLLRDYQRDFGERMESPNPSDDGNNNDNKSVDDDDSTSNNNNNNSKKSKRNANNRSLYLSNTRRASQYRLGNNNNNNSRRRDSISVATDDSPSIRPSDPGLGHTLNRRRQIAVAGNTGGDQSTNASGTDASKPRRLSEEYAEESDDEFIDNDDEETKKARKEREDKEERARLESTVTRSVAMSWYLKSGGVVWIVFTVLFYVFTYACFAVLNLILSGWTAKRQAEADALANITKAPSDGSNSGPVAPTITAITDFSPQDFQMYLGIALIAGIIFLLLGAVSFYIWIRQAATTMHSSFVAALLQVPIQWLYKTGVSAVMGRVNLDFFAIDLIIHNLTFGMITFSVVLINGIVIMIISSGYMAIILVLCAVVFSHTIYRSVTAIPNMSNGISSGPMVHELNQACSGLAVIRVFGLRRALIRRHQEAVIKHHHPLYGVRMSFRWLSARLEIVSCFIFVFISVFAIIGKYLAQDRSTDATGRSTGLLVSPALTSLALSLASESSGMIGGLTKNIADFDSEASSIDALYEYVMQIPSESYHQYATLSTPDENNNNINENDNNNNNANNNNMNTTNTALSLVHDNATTVKSNISQKSRLISLGAMTHEFINFVAGTFSYENNNKLKNLTEIQEYAPSEDWVYENPSIEFKNVSLGYHRTLPLALKNVSFKLKPRSKIGVVGKPGSGKSSLLYTIFRLHEILTGRILMDGRDITRHTDLRDVRKRVTVVNQEGILFNGTIRQNLDPFNENTDEAIWKVLTDLGLRNRIEHGDVADLVHAAALQMNVANIFGTKLDELDMADEIATVATQQTTNMTTMGGGTGDIVTSTIQRGDHKASALRNSRALNDNNQSILLSSSQKLQQQTPNNNSRSSRHHQHHGRSGKINKGQSVRVSNMDLLQAQQGTTADQAKEKRIGSFLREAVTTTDDSKGTPTNNAVATSPAVRRENSGQAFDGFTTGGVSNSNNVSPETVSSVRRINNSNPFIRSSSNSRNQNGDDNDDDDNNVDDHDTNNEAEGEDALARTMKNKSYRQQTFRDLATNIHRKIRVIRSLGHHQSQKLGDLSGILRGPRAAAHQSTTIVDIMNDEKSTTTPGTDGVVAENKNKPTAEGDGITTPSGNKFKNNPNLTISVSADVAGAGREVKGAGGATKTGASLFDGATDEDTTSGNNTDQDDEDDMNNDSNDDGDDDDILKTKNGRNFNASASGDLLSQRLMLFAQDDEDALKELSEQAKETQMQHEEQQILAGILEEAFDNLPKGLDTLVAGVNSGIEQFSKSELQLLCLARAMLRDAPIVLLDDATSGLDDETDTKIQKVIRNHFSGRTIITVSHRLSTVIDADQLIVMKDGCVEEDGRPIDLLRKTKKKKNGEHAGIRGVAEKLGPEMYKKFLQVAEGKLSVDAL